MLPRMDLRLLGHSMSEGWSKPEDYIDVYPDGEYIIVYLKFEKRTILMKPHDAEYIARQLQLILATLKPKAH